MTNITIDENSTVTMNGNNLTAFNGNVMVDNFESMLKGIREKYSKLEYKNIISIPYMVRHKQDNINSINYEIEHLNTFINDVDGLIEYLKDIWPKIKEEKKFDTIFVVHKELTNFKNLIKE